MANGDPPRPKPLRGFAAMSPEKQREIASKGGKALRPEQRTFSKDPSLARAAAIKGGQSVEAAKRSFSQDRALASSAGTAGASKRRKGPGRTLR